MKKPIVVLLVVLAIIGIAAIGIAVSKNGGNVQGQDNNDQGQVDNGQGQTDLGPSHGCKNKPDYTLCHGVKCDGITQCLNGQCVCQT